ncbi:MAG: hypothetical protein MPEBLZ_03740 [Candidatus Methanoperedens nitroreducens]|uniref:DUF2117 domain-containing protein n=1 Tax=Candidatus Methanoperedens nitratireducens TaxID=1392998 RepID=A0A0P7ZAY5_9EURY|nr:DUF2117 domain-containing protein [Candidatus Methanoperedens sp. BLZ2]KAB2944786.1 MAG: DUF2117 domain-containing protein [Candidatus Methanoperedens sp.]KPQ41712.1 MAG: hypothetical protein MPEBLZ_03740 [Candidatus Methanoperedens sp. BLZ1]MBZ0177075.1 DUF2117 domain-containing protein [Candidatus Methanoperedens nitroreducens]MCX9077506.1 DUF2117 domain-containing protein [Candidatus Methanoperedens sp.]
MRIGIILHGPEIVDMGSAGKIIGIFKKEHDITARLGGTMGRTAVLDAGLENIIDISGGLTPSETIIAMKNDIDLAILLNHGKTLDTGRYFGRIVASKLDNLLPFVHIESPDNNGRIIYYYPPAKRCAEFVRNFLAKYGTYDLPVEPGIPEPSHIRINGELVIRSIGGAFIGENIRLDGIVIGETTNPDIEIVCRDGKIIRLKGIKVKPHGLEKLENRVINLFTAKVKTGGIRRTRPKPRIRDINSKKSNNKIAIIDHAAESTFELVQDAGLVITVGDDTTTIAADILARLGIPVIGIIDGDMDNVLENTVVPEGSIIIRVLPGFDDVVGREISQEIMQGKQQFRHDKDELTAKILTLAEKYVVEVTYY